jgi:hypothetical protein
MMGTRRFLFKFIGKRIALLFGGVCFLSVAVLAALYLTSAYALQAYVSDQVKRLPWDVVANQSAPVQSYPRLQKEYRTIPGIKQIELFGMLRGKGSALGMELQADGKPVPVRWFVIVAASNPDILLPDLRLRGNGDIGTADGDLPPLQVALVGASGRALDMGPGSLLQLRTVPQTAEFDNHQGTQEEEFGSHTHGSDVNGPPRTVFEGRVTHAPVQMERVEFNKWLLNNVGSLSYLPERSLVITVPMATFAQIAATLESGLISTQGLHGVESAPPFIPEVSHLIKIDRDQVFSAWDLTASLHRLAPLVRWIHDGSTEVTPYVNVTSDLYVLLSHMADIAALVGLVSLLVGIPLLCLAWVVGKMLSHLLLMNERRLIGLALIRGVPVRAVSQTITVALLLGGAGGGVLGLIAGFGLPVLGHALTGGPVPPFSVLLGGIVYFPIFLALGIGLALLSGRSMINQIRQLTPREAVSHVVGKDLEDSSQRASRAFVGASLVALILGLYKLVCWIFGYSLLLGAFKQALPAPLTASIEVAETLLDFIAVPLFLAGLVGLLRWRLRQLQYVLNIVAAPLVGRLRWFVAEHMAISRLRIASTIFITALAISMALLPQIAADSFYERILRGVNASLGTDLQLEYNLARLAGEHEEAAPVAKYYGFIQAKLSSIETALRHSNDVRGTAEVLQFMLPEVYMPTQSGLMLNLIDPGDYKKNVYYEENIGLNESFSKILASLSGDTLAASSGLMRTRNVPLGEDVALGSTDDFSPITAKFKDVIAFLPGQPSIGVSQREGYAAAEVDYINYMMTSDARVISTLERFTRPPLNGLNVLPSKAVFLVNTRSVDSLENIAALVASLPVRPETIRTRSGELQKVGKDMFISLALENMKVFMIGGLLLALSGVFVAGIANFIAERRTLGLLRLRGVPLPLLLRISLSMFLVPVLVGVLLGILLGAVSGYGIAEAIWELPRVYGFGGFLENHLLVTATAWSIVLVFTVILSAVALGFGLWPFRRSAREGV